MFAGSLPGKTQTLPVAIFVELSQDFHVALAIAALLVAVSAGLLVAVKLLLPRSSQLLQPWILASGPTSISA